MSGDKVLASKTAGAGLGRKGGDVGKRVYIVSFFVTPINCPGRCSLLNQSSNDATTPKSCRRGWRPKQQLDRPEHAARCISFASSSLRGGKARRSLTQQERMTRKNQHNKKQSAIENRASRKQLHTARVRWYTMMILLSRP